MCDPEVVLEAGTEAFTEGEWRGHEGAVGFVANQMEVLEGMWLRGNEYIDVDEDWLIVAATFGGGGIPALLSRWIRSMSSGSVTERSCSGRSF